MLLVYVTAMLQLFFCKVMGQGNKVLVLKVKLLSLTGARLPHQTKRGWMGKDKNG